MHQLFTIMSNAHALQTPLQQDHFQILDAIQLFPTTSAMYLISSDSQFSMYEYMMIKLHYDSLYISFYFHFLFHIQIFLLSII